MIEATCIRVGDYLTPATEADKQKLCQLKAGAGYRCDIYAQSDRSIKHHRLFYGGLIKLAMMYYEQPKGLITPAERNAVMKFAGFLGKHSKNEQALINAAEAFLSGVEQSRLDKITPPPVTIDSFVRWLKIQVGYFDYETSPDGSVRKIPKSINFNSMSQEQFNDFYKDCFSVVWNLVLRNKFDTEASAQNAIDQLIAMG